MPIDTSIDHIGPMTQTVLDNAKMLKAIAGEDGLDPRQCNLKIDNYVDEIDRGINHLRIGILKEGFGWHASESDVDSKVRKAVDLFANLELQSLKFQFLCIAKVMRCGQQLDWKD